MPSTAEAAEAVYVKRRTNATIVVRTEGRRLPWGGIVSEMSARSDQDGGRLAAFQELRMPGKEIYKGKFAPESA